MLWVKQKGRNYAQRMEMHVDGNCSPIATSYFCSVSVTAFNRSLKLTQTYAISLTLSSCFPEALNPAELSVLNMSLQNEICVSTIIKTLKTISIYSFWPGLSKFLDY